MLVSIISGFTPEQSTIVPNNSLKPGLKMNLLQKDSFELQKKTNPSFRGIIPSEAVIAHLDGFAEKMKGIETVDKLREAAKEFFIGLHGAVYQNAKHYQGIEGSGEAVSKKLSHNLQYSEEDQLIHSGYINNIGNKCAMARMLICDKPQSSFDFMQKELEKFIESMKYCLKKWTDFEEWCKDPTQKKQSGKIFDLFDELEYHISVESSDFVAEVLEGMKAYSKDKPIIEIEDDFQSNIWTHYADFRIKKCEPMSDEQLKEIFSGLIKSLRNSQYNDDFGDLIQEGGSHIRIPLFRIDSNSKNLY